MRFLVTLLVLGWSLFGAIQEMPYFSELQGHVAKGTLVVLDIDDTLLVPTQMLGDDRWFRGQVDKHQKAGMADFFDKALAEWEAIRHLTQVQVVEQGSPQLVRALQEQGVAVIGLTTQGLGLATRTVHQLKALGFDLARSAPSRQELHLMNGHGILFRAGILFTAGTNKGTALLKLLDAIGYRPERVVFVNDKKSHLVDMEGPLEQAGIAFMGLRYGYSDARCAAYRADVAQVQFERSTFTHILSDEEALAILQGGS
jgi:phosphoserine phosphatase